MAKKKEVVEVKSKKVVREMDKFDLEAEREGKAITRSNETRVKNFGMKPKVKPFKGGG